MSKINLSDLDAPATVPTDPGPMETFHAARGTFAHEEILDPTTGELIPTGDADALIDALDRITTADSTLYAAKVAVRSAITALAAGTTKTRRVQGKRRRAVVELPADAWDQSKLKEAWNSFPALRDQVLKIGTIAVQLREWGKFRNTSGVPEIETLKNMIAAANRGPVGTPTVKIEQ